MSKSVNSDYGSCNYNPANSSSVSEDQPSHGHQRNFSSSVSHFTILMQGLIKKKSKK